VSEYEKEIFSLAQQLLGKPRSKSEIPPSQPNAPSKLSESEVEVRPENADAPKVKETKTAAELARMIEDGLSKHPECPRKGFVVTVYGGTLWRAMPTITPAAGAVPQPAGMARSHRGARRAATQAVRLGLAAGGAGAPRRGGRR
jgi:hypothetical protein